MDICNNNMMTLTTHPSIFYQTTNYDTRFWGAINFYIIITNLRNYQPSYS